MVSIKWDDRFNIGVDIVDKAHQRLFSIVHKLLDLTEDTMKHQHACRETIKYFKNYTLKHFSEEEAYMQSINYSGYAIHKRLHDNLRDKTLPALEAELEEQNYSEEAIQHFLGICIGWLTGHIVIEDRAITGRTKNKWIYDPLESDLSVLERAINEVMKEMFEVEPQVVSECYGGEKFGNGIFLRFTYLTQDANKIRVFLALEKKLVIYTHSKMMGKRLHKVDNTTAYAVQQLSQQLLKRTGMFFKLLESCKLERIDRLTDAQFHRVFEKQCPPYSLLYNVGGNGYFAFVIQEQ